MAISSNKLLKIGDGDAINYSANLDNNQHVFKFSLNLDSNLSNFTFLSLSGGPVFQFLPVKEHLILWVSSKTQQVSQTSISFG